MMKLDAMSLKKCFQHHSKLLDLKLAVARYGINFIGFIELVLIPLIVSPFYYSTIEKDKQLISFMPIVLLGAGLGFLKLHFNRGDPYLKWDYFFGSFVTGFLFCAILYSFGFGFIYVIAAFLIIIVSVLEKLLVVQNQLISASSYKAFISIALVLIACLIGKTGFVLDPTSLYAVSIISGLSIWILMVRRKLVLFSGSFSWFSVRSLKTYRDLINNGFVLNFHTYLIILYFIFDRYIYTNFFESFLPGYSLAFAFSQISLVLVHSVAYSLQYKFGENINSVSVDEYNQFKFAVIKAFLFIYLCTLPFVYLYSVFLSNYQDFFKIYALVSLFNGMYFSISATSIVALYLGVSKQALATFMLALVANAVISPAIGFIEGSFYYNLIKSGIILVGSAVLLDWKVSRLIKPS